MGGGGSIVAAKFCMDVKTHVKSTAQPFFGGIFFIYYVIMIYAN